MVTRSARETAAGEDAGMKTMKRVRRPVRPDQLIARADALRHQFDQLAAVGTTGDWRRRQRKSETLARLLAQETRLRSRAAPADTFDYPF